MVQVHVEQRKLQLPDRLHAALEVLGRQHAIEQGSGQRLGRVDVTGHTL